MSPENLVAEIQLKRLSERALGTGEPCTCEHINLLQSFHKGTLSIPCYIALTVWSTSIAFQC